jgi:hypothetical protein
MPTSRPFNAPSRFTPRFTPEGLLQRSVEQSNRQVQAMRNLAARGGGPFPTDGPIGPRSSARVGAVGNLVRPLNQVNPLQAIRGLFGVASELSAGAIQPMIDVGNWLTGKAQRGPMGDIGNQLNQLMPRSRPFGLANIPPSAGGESYRDAELRLSAAAQGGGRGGGNMGNSINPGFASTSDRPVGTEAVLNGRPVYWGGKNYGWQQKQPGGGGGFDTGTLAAVKDRAYQEEVISTAQQTASNPLFQKYQVAELTKQYNEAKDPNKKRDIGLQIWAQTNPALAAKLKEGQLGYAQAQAAPGMSNSGGNLIGGLPMPSMNFNFSTDVQTPGTMEQNFGAVIPGVGMTSKTPMYDREMTARLFATPEDLSNFAFGKALIPDPGLTKMTEDQRRTLAAQYNMGLK